MGASSTTSPTHYELASSACREYHDSAIIDFGLIATNGCGEHFNL
jgi:hypothetical protein